MAEVAKYSQIVYHLTWDDIVAGMISALIFAIIFKVVDEIYDLIFGKTVVDKYGNVSEIKSVHWMLDQVVIGGILWYFFPSLFWSIVNYCLNGIFELSRTISGIILSKCLM